MKIDFAGHELVLHSSGIVLWPKHEIAIVSDLHLEKGSHFALRGFFLPPYDSQATLKKLIDVCTQEQVKNLIILGDCFHDSKGFTRLPKKAADLFNSLLSFNPIWIKGNHDKDFVPPHFIAYETYEKDGLVFRHEAEPGAINEISGHFHPKAQIMHKNALIQRPCFIEDGKKLMLPSFGVYTGGLFIDEPAIRNKFDPSFRFYMVGQDKIYRFENDRGVFSNAKS